MSNKLQNTKVTDKEQVEVIDMHVAAAWLGRRGGQARARNLTPEERSKGARLAAKARWKKAKVQA